MNRLRLPILLTILLAALCACQKTTLTLQSTPPGAQFVLDRSGIRGNTNTQLKLSKDVFAGSQQISDKLRLEMPGYRSVTVPVSLSKGRKNVTSPAVIKLEPLSTSITIASSPPGAQIKLVDPATAGAVLPPDWRLSFRTPVTFVCTSAEAAVLAPNLRFASFLSEGNVATGFAVNDPVPLKADQNVTVTIPFEPLITTLGITTEPEGATVEDVSPAGFGNLGKTTPVKHNFTWQDIRTWVDRQPVTGRAGAFDAIVLNLRISKRGYTDVLLPNIRLPIGQERNFNRILQPVLSQIRFESDPPGVQVFVSRTITTQVLDPTTGAITDVPVTSLKNLGMTPFDLTLDPEDPIDHGTELVWQKTGFGVTAATAALNKTRFAQGQKKFLHVMAK